MATNDEVRRIAHGLPGVVERVGRHDWRVWGKTFVWERPLRESRAL